jgi:hypothetical protein
VSKSPSGKTPADAPAKIRLLALLLLGVCLPILLVALLEGFSSFLLLFLALGQGDQTGERLGRRYTRYDAELGWTSAPNFTVPDMYGPGTRLQIDSRGFRETRTTAATPSPPRLRVTCSGDSFTFGFGVADDRTWCARLAAIDPRLATVNMGQSGYGMDQAYLWYKRDGVRLDQEVHLFTYITNDFIRMESSSVYGYAKPVLVLQDDSLTIGNVPVPRSEGRARLYWTAVLMRNQLRLAQLLLWVRDSVYHGHGVQQGDLSGKWTTEDSLTWHKVQRLVGDLSRINGMKGSTLILVHLPVLEDYWTAQSDPWRERARAAAADGEFTFVDLVQEFRQLPGDSVQQMFIGPRFPGYPNTAGHYSVAGNEWVAERIHQRLLEIPAVAARLGPSGE